MTKQRATFRRDFSRFSADEIAPNIETWEAARRVPRALIKKTAAFGVFGFGIDEACGGPGFDDAFLRSDHAGPVFGCGATCEAMQVRQMGSAGQ